MKLKFIDLFAGTGGIRIGFENACKKLGIDTECVMSSEIDKKARETYELNFKEKPLGQDSRRQLSSMTQLKCCSQLIVFPRGSTI